MCRLDLCVVLLVLTQARINKKRNYLKTFTCNQVSAIHDSDRHSRPKRLLAAENAGIELIGLNVMTFAEQTTRRNGAQSAPADELMRRDSPKALL